MACLDWGGSCHTEGGRGESWVLGDVAQVAESANLEPPPRGICHVTGSVSLHLKLAELGFVPCRVKQPTEYGADGHFTQSRKGRARLRAAQPRREGVTPGPWPPQDSVLATAARSDHRGLVFLETPFTAQVKNLHFPSPLGHKREIFFPT